MNALAKSARVRGVSNPVSTNKRHLEKPDDSTKESSIEGMKSVSLQVITNGHPFRELSLNKGLVSNIHILS